MNIGKKEKEELLREAQEFLTRPTNEPLHVVILKCYKDTVKLDILKYITVEYLINMASRKFDNLGEDDYLREIKTMVENKQLEVVKSKLPYLKRTVRLYNPDR